MAETANKVKIVLQKDLPLSCPMPDEALWNQHPRVYIALDGEGKGTCPYCGNQFQLQAKQE